MTPPLKVQIDALARTLLASAKAREWLALARHDQTTAKLLDSLKPVPAELTAALANLKRAHQEAMALAEAEKQRLSGQINHVRDNQEGLRAYRQMEEIA
ncbi:hypothetical protein [Gallaecimonas xiamenensis]|uniref:Flagellar protein FliT n=1 Tax=Gallaecimonas xiamenensis 3-C-1 TaxID=745411 RepID=K2JFP8_9GAMM|nr:hypothetical protein [Gallaecimonas xiamenensis]EKE73988.1 hypothetical protein B3C1_09223 [Gallaecimonas xiamenensis 3-C-1]